MVSSIPRKSRLEEAMRLLEMLLEDRERYFDRMGYLNSDGMKVVLRATRIIVEELPEYHRRMGDIRASRDIETIAKLVGELEGKISRIE